MKGNTNNMVIFNGSNYPIWKVRMKDLLYMNDCHLPVFEIEKPENKTDSEWTLCHRMVCGFIRQWVGDNALNLVSEETNARSLWNKLEQLYAPKTACNKIVLLGQLIRLTYRDGTSMTDHLNTFQGMINQLVQIGVEFTDEVQAILLLSTLRDSWKTFMEFLNDSIPDGDKTLDLVQSSLLSEEMRRKTLSSSQLDLTVIEKRGRSKSRGPENGDKSKNNVECYHCGLKGHIQKHCRRLQWQMADPL